MPLDALEQLVKFGIAAVVVLLTIRELEFTEAGAPQKIEQRALWACQRARGR
jgi:hypothetical protein